MNDKDYLKLAIEQAKLSVEEGGFPAGSIIVKDGRIISKGLSLGFKSNDPTGHSDTIAIREACKVLKTTNLNGAILYSSIEPCIMCFSAANWAGISKIVYGCKKTNKMVEKGYYEGKSNIAELNVGNNHKIELEYVPDYENEIIKLITDWEESL